MSHYSAVHQKTRIFMQVIFSHGHLSSPDSTKIVHLSKIARQLGLETLAIDYRDLQDDPPGRAIRLLDTVHQQPEAPILVGSSMGGWVAMHAAEAAPVSALFLMAPALFLEDRVPDGTVPERYLPQTRHISVVHGWHDEIIPWRHSLRFAESSAAELHLLDSDHGLESALPGIEAIFHDFLTRAGHSAQALSRKR